jgi:RNA polymerase sigma-70 factor (ECF subfamily)
MASSFPGVMSHAGILVPALESKRARYHKIYNEHGHRIYSLAFWMTDHELVAEQLAARTFARAFSASEYPRAEHIDQAFLAEIREVVAVQGLTLSTVVNPDAPALGGNIKRIHLERAVVQLPATEKLIFLLHDVEGYEHCRISSLLEISEEDSRLGLHLARLRIRELLAQVS